MVLKKGYILYWENWGASSSMFLLNCISFLKMIYSYKSKLLVYEKLKRLAYKKYGIYNLFISILKNQLEMVFHYHNISVPWFEG